MAPQRSSGGADRGSILARITCIVSGSRVKGDDSWRWLRVKAGWRSRRSENALQSGEMDGLLRWSIRGNRPGLHSDFHVKTVAWLTGSAWTNTILDPGRRRESSGDGVVVAQGAGFYNDAGLRILSRVKDDLSSAGRGRRVLLVASSGRLWWPAAVVLRAERLAFRLPLDRAEAHYSIGEIMRLGVRDVASQFGVSDKVVLRWVDEDDLPASKVDGQYRFSPAALFEWAAARGMKIPPALFREPENGDREVFPNLVEALRAGGVIAGVGGADKREVLAAMIGHLKLPRGVDHESFLQVVMAREQLGSTGIGGGIAIPHVRNPMVLRVPKPMLLLGLLEKPVEYAAVDHKPVHAIFLVITPTTRSHLHILSRLGYVLQDGEIRRLLESRAPSEKILDAIVRVESSIPTAG